MPTKKSARQEPLTLAQFDVAVDEHAGSPQLFASTVRALRECRAESAAVQERRDEVFAVMKDHYERGDHDAGEYRLDKARDGEPKTRRTVPSAVIKKHSPTLWSQARVQVPYVQAKAPANTPGVAVESLPSVPERARLADVVAVYQSLGGRLAELREVEQEMVDRLKKIGANNGWDGLPIEFADGWKVSLTQLQYSSERLAMIAPETFACLAVETTTTPTGHVFVRRVSGGASDEGE